MKTTPNSPNAVLKLLRMESELPLPPLSLTLSPKKCCGKKVVVMARQISQHFP
jgi:hypothetical protein